MSREARLTVGWLAVMGLLTTVLALSYEGPRKIDAGGLKLRVQIDGQAREGQPTVVFVSGLGEGVEAWELVQPQVAQLTRTVSYDRAGLGQSEMEEARPTFQRVAAQLHTLLQNAGIKPPYVLVGHSIGGPHIRMFAGLYPGEVAGLVFVDPTDFTQTRADQLAIWTELGSGEAGLNAFEKSIWGPLAQAPAAVRAEAEVAEKTSKSGWEEFRSLPPIPNVPVVFLMAGKNDHIPLEMKMVVGRQRMEHFMKLGAGVADGTLVVTTRSDHRIQFSEPELVTWAIKRVLHL
jgi:pimeloyl-ACP methyl ester carboxylesterase